MNTKKKTCERCSYPAERGGRFCSVCKQKVLKEMQESSYLQDTPCNRRRVAGAKEDTRETRMGTEH